MSAYAVGTLYTCNGCKYLDFKKEKCLKSNISINSFVDNNGYKTMFKPKQCKGYQKNNFKTKDRGKKMTNTNTNELKEALNEVNIVGFVKEKNLEIKKDDKGVTYITGTIDIQTDKNSSHKVFVYSKELKGNGEPSKVYTGLVTVMNEYVSKAQLLKEYSNKEKYPNITPSEAESKAETEATKVRVSGKISRMEYYRNGELISYPQITANFFSRIDEDKYQPKAEFDIVIYYDKIIPEIKGDEETGRVKVSGYIAQFNGTIIPVEFVTDEDTSEYILNNFETKRTGEIWGDLISTAITKIEKKNGFGKDMTKSHTTYVNEMLITGGDDQLDEDDPKAFKVSDIKNACTTRETEYLPSLFQRSQNKQNNKQTKSSAVSEAKKSFAKNW